MNRAATLALAPLSGIYGLAIRARNASYRLGLFPIHEGGAPVISVGNLTTGGTGKTPLVEWIANESAQAGRCVCILTRGYGRNSRGQRVMVSDGSTLLADATQAGDEAFLLAESLKGKAAVISDADRVSAARWASDHLETDVFVLDDGFQHQRIARNLNVVTIDATNPWGNGRLLPAGVLREPLAAMSRADCIVITRADDSDSVSVLQKQIAKFAKGIPVFLSRMKQTHLRRIGKAVSSIDLDSAKALPVAAFCGIGNPQSFFSLLRRESYQLTHTEAFRDHHAYTQADIDRIQGAAIARDAQALITTAKDEVKLRSLKFSLPCFVAEIAIEIERKDELRDLILKAIDLGETR